MARKQSKFKQADYFDMLKRERVSLRQHYVLYQIYTGRSIDLTSPDVQTLKDRGLVNNNGATSKGEEFIMTIERVFRGQNNMTSRQLMGDDFNEKILKFRNIFPNKKLKSGKAAWQSPAILEKAFRWFFQTFDYDWETIYKATKIYIERQDFGENQYCQTSQYFIRKGENSALSDICEEIRTGTQQETKSRHQVKVV